MRRSAVTPLRLAAAAVLLVATAVLLSPVSCSQSSEDPRPRCETLLGYWTPFGDGVQLLLPVGIWLAVSSARRALARGRSDASRQP